MSQHDQWANSLSDWRGLLPHTFADRVDTLRRTQRGGLWPYPGAIFGMAESDKDVRRRLTDFEPHPARVVNRHLVPFWRPSGGGAPLFGSTCTQRPGTESTDRGPLPELFVVDF